MRGQIIHFHIPYYEIVFHKNNKCKECGGAFIKDQLKEHMLHYAIIKYCSCGNRIVIGYDGKIYEN